MSKRPSFQFYPSDWRNDPALRLCSTGARGLWIEMLCLMHEGQPYGHLTVQGRPITADALARLVGESASAVKRWMRELAENEVYSVGDDQVIFSRRMVRDEDIRERRAAGGQAGGEHGKKGGAHGSKGGRPKKQITPDQDGGRGEEKPPLKPPPSSSSPSSSSESPKPPARVHDPAAGMPPARRAIMEAGGYVSPPGDWRTLQRWQEAGADLEQDILPVLRREAAALRRRTGEAPRTLSIFDQAMREKMAEDAAEIERLRRVTARYTKEPETQE